MGRVSALLAVALLSFQSVEAQSLSDFLKLLGNYSGTTEQSDDKAPSQVLTTESLLGTWNYYEPAARYDGDDVIGSLGLSALESLLPSLYSKAGLKAGSGSVTFSSPDVFSARIGEYNITGKFRITSSDGAIILSATVRNVSGTLYGHAAIENGTLTLVIDAAKAAALAEQVSPKAASNNYFKILKSVLNSYPGMKFGCKMKR